MTRENILIGRRPVAEIDDEEEGKRDEEHQLRRNGEASRPRRLDGGDEHGEQKT